MTQPTAAISGIRSLLQRDLPEVVRIDAEHTGRSKATYWGTVFEDFLDDRHADSRLGLAAHREGELEGYLFGEIRAFEFGSEPCGWVFAVGVARDAEHHGIGTALVEEACRWFRQHGITIVRTMVRRNDVPLLAFFRSNGFSGGSFVQLELDVTDLDAR